MIFKLQFSRFEFCPNLVLCTLTDSLSLHVVGSGILVDSVAGCTLFRKCSYCNFLGPVLSDVLPCAWKPILGSFIITYFLVVAFKNLKKCSLSSYLKTFVKHNTCFILTSFLCPDGGRINTGYPSLITTFVGTGEC